MKSVTLLSVVIGLFFLASVSLAQTTILLNENFDNYMPGDFPCGWVEVWSGAGWEYQVVTSEQSFSPPNSFKMQGTWGWGACIEYPLNPPPQVIYFESKIFVTEGSEEQVTIGPWRWEEGPWGTGYCSIDFMQGMIRLSPIASGGFLDLLSYERNRWYGVKVKYDASVRTATVWVDGQLIVEDVSMVSGGLGYDAIRLHNGWGGVVGYYDGIKFWTVGYPHGDVNCDNQIDLGDVVYLISYLYKSGPPPCEPVDPTSYGITSGSSFGMSRSSNQRVTIMTIGFAPISRPEGKVVELPVSAELGVDVAGIQLGINYDPKQITLLEPSLTSRTQGLQLYSNTKDGIQKIGIVDMSGQNYIQPGDGPLVTLRAQGNDLSSLTIKEAILVDKDANKIPVEIIKTITTTESNSVPQAFALKQNSPNPFNPSTSIQYTVASSQSPVPTTLKVYNIRGQLVRTLVTEPKTTGTYEVIWNGKDEQGNQVASGIYFYKLKAGDFSETKKMILMK